MGNNASKEEVRGKKKSRSLYIINAPFCFSYSNAPFQLPLLRFVLLVIADSFLFTLFYTSCEFLPFLSFLPPPLVVLLANKMGRKKGGGGEGKRDSGVTLWNLSVK